MFRPVTTGVQLVTVDAQPTQLVRRLFRDRLQGRPEAPSADTAGMFGLSELLFALTIVFVMTIVAVVIVLVAR